MPSKRARHPRARSSPPSRPTIHMAPDPTTQKFVANYVQSGNITAAAEAAGVSERTGHRMIKRPDVLRRIQDAFQHAGITDDRIASTLANALEAKKVVMVPDGRGGVDVREYDDHITRLRAVRLVLDTSIKMRALDIAEGADGEEEAIPADLTGLPTTEILKLAVTRITLRKGG